MLFYIPKIKLGWKTFLTNNVLLVFFFAIFYYIVNHYESTYNKKD